MKNKKTAIGLTIGIVGLLSLITASLILIGMHTPHPPYSVALVQPVVEMYSKADFTASLDVARVFGRAPACAEADPKLILLIARSAQSVQLDARLLAAAIAVESGCNQYATSSKGAIGLCQIVPRVWKGTYDFENRYNLLNREDNIHVGASILAGLIKQYGTTAGLHHYNGLGADGDPGYSDKIEQLAAHR